MIPTNAAPITFYVRESADWLPHALAQQSVDEQLLAAALSPEALRIRTLLEQRGACFANDLQRIAGLTRAETSRALWELATAGLAAADGFDQLRALMDPRRKAATTETSGKRPIRTTAGRWSLLSEQQAAPERNPIAQARRTDAALESFARMLLARYGVLFRDLLTRESNAPKWRTRTPEANSDNAVTYCWTISMVSRVTASGASNLTPCHPSMTCGPLVPMPSRNRPPESCCIDMADIASMAGLRAPSCAIAVPSAIRSVRAAR